MKHNPIQFAVVREDPLTELSIIERKKIKKVLTIGSGGCTAFSLQCINPTLDITIFDTNLAQLTLVKNKALALSNRANKADFNASFGIGNEAPLGFNSNGNFESLFRGLRNFIFDFVAPKEELLELFQEQNRLEIYRDIITNKYWPVGFELYFSDTLLRAMFTDAAVQHVEKGSYPKYFRRQLEQGLLSKEAPSNYFLHHIFLGHYLNEGSKLPIYLSSANRNFPLKYIHGDLYSIEDLAPYDFISLSNIFDWMNPDQVQESASYLSKKCLSGTTLLWRQLGHDRDMSQFFPGWSFDIKLAEDILLADRSLFYSRIYIATRR